MRAMTLETVKKHKQFVLLKFKGRNRIEAVEDLISAALYMRKEELEPLQEGEHYWYQLIGMEVRTDRGQYLGTLEKIFNAGSNDVYVVQQGKREWLIPALRDVIREVDIDKKQMIICPMEGLLDENDL